MVATNSVIKNAANKFIVICGPTASGKSALAIRIAQKINAVIINADSQQVYADLNILSACPTCEEMQQVPHHLFGVMGAEEVCDVARWIEMVRAVIAENQNRPIIIVGGTGMYIRALMHGIAEIPDIPEEVKEKVRNMPVEELKCALGDEWNGNTQRMMRALEVRLATGKPIKEWQAENHKSWFSPDDFIVFYLNVSRETLYEKINNRLVLQLEQGALDEVSALMQKSLNPDNPIMKAHGVPEFIKYLNNEITLEEALQKAQTNVRNYAKRQQTWFRHQLLQKHEIGANDDEKILEIIKKDENIFQ